MSNKQNAIWISWICFVFLNIFDAITTEYVLNIHGIASELNSIVRYFLLQYGIHFIFYWKLIIIAGLWLLRKYIPLIVLIWVNSIFFVVVLINIYSI